jgi:hypothetical protein
VVNADARVARETPHAADGQRAPRVAQLAAARQVPDTSLARFSVHFLDEAGRPHIRPVRGNVLKAILSSVLAVHHRPAGRNSDKRGPQRMLILVVDQDQENAFFIFERIRHELSCGINRLTGSILT